MHAQVVTYRLADISDPEFNEADREFADGDGHHAGPASEGVAQDPDDNVYGGVYLWQDRPACQNFLASELWGEVLKDK